MNVLAQNSQCLRFRSLVVFYKGCKITFEKNKNNFEQKDRQYIKDLLEEMFNMICSVEKNEYTDTINHTIENIINIENELRDLFYENNVTIVINKSCQYIVSNNACQAMLEHSTVKVEDHTFLDN